MTCGELILVLRDLSMTVTGLEIREEPDQHGRLLATAARISTGGFWRLPWQKSR